MLDCQLKSIARKLKNVSISVIFTFKLWKVDIKVKSFYLLICQIHSINRKAVREKEQKGRNLNENEINHLM